MTIEQEVRLSKALLFGIQQELARGKLGLLVPPQIQGMPWPAGEAIVAERVRYTRTPDGARAIEAYERGQINEYRLCQPIIKAAVARLKADGLVCPREAAQCPDWMHTAYRRRRAF